MNMFLIGAALTAFIGGWGLLFYLRRETLKRGKAEAHYEDAEEAIDAARGELDRLAGRPRSDTDVVISLRDKARARRDKGEA